MRPETLSVLVDIRDAARFITDDTAGATYDEFLEDRRTRQAVLFNVVIIGEAMNRLRRRDRTSPGKSSMFTRLSV